MRQYIDVPTTTARLLRTALHTAPAFVDEALSIDMRSSGKCSASNSQHGGSSAGTASSPTISPVPGMQSSQNQSPGQIMPAVPGICPVMPQSTVIAPFGMLTTVGRPQTSRHVYFCVRNRLTRDQYTIVERRTDTLRDDDEFYDWLKQTYIEVRGLFRYWLSPYRYETCEFVKVSTQ